MCMCVCVCWISIFFSSVFLRGRMRIQRWFSGGLRRYSSCGSPLVPSVAMGERWPPYPTGERKTRKLEKRAHAEKGAWGTRREKRKRGSRGAFLRDVAFAGHHAYVTLREGHVRAYNTIRGVIPPSPPLSLSLSDTSSTSTSPSPSSSLSWTLFHRPLSFDQRSLHSA